MRNMYLPSMPNRAQMYLGIYWIFFLFLLPLVFIVLLDWHPVFVRIFTTTMMVITGIVLFAYGAVMRYPSPKKVGQYPEYMRAEITEKRKVLQPYIRILLLALSIGIAWGFGDFFKDVGCLLAGESDFQTVTGKVASVETLWGTAPFYQNIQLDGDAVTNYPYFYNFLRRLSFGQKIEITILKKSKTIIEARLN